nr:ABC transporter substrate-binding protein [uncultured Oscillibacter sp.]
MLKRKNWLAGLLAVVMLLGLTACGGGNDSATTDNGSQTEQTGGDAAPSDLTEWEQSSNIYATDETDEELYERALEEGATVTLYSISSRCTKVAEAFMAKYPGLECVPFDISTDELLEKVTREYEAGVHTCDVVHIKDQDGSMYLEYVANKIFYNYQPADIFSHIDPEYTATATPLYIELTQLFYNTEAYPDGSPITNLWQLTEPQWKGKIMMQNPLDNLAWGSWITGFCVGEEPDRLAAAYKDLYGEELVLSDGCANAGYEFLKRLKENEPVFTASSDEIAESVGTPGQSDPPVGFCASSKLRKAEENGWVFAPVNLEPDTGIPAVNTLYIVEGSEHPAAAKLLVRFMMGGVDGDTSGYEPFNTLGGWPVRDDIAPAEGSVDYSGINVAPFDVDEIYYNYNTVRDFWQMLG